MEQGIDLSDSFIEENPELFGETHDEFTIPGPIEVPSDNSILEENLETSLDKPLSLSFMQEHQDLFRSNNPDPVTTESPWDESALKPGSILYDYAIGDKLGSGGMGEVYKAVDIRNRRDVAIKILKTKSKSANEHFRREYKFLSSINHPNLVKAYDFREVKNELYLIMEFVGGKSLKELITENRLYFVDKIAIACQIAQGIEVLNLAGIIHRDLKPANIMVNEKDGVVKILDLGLGKDTQDEGELQLTRAKQILGTCYYMAPEQTEGEVTTTTDIFALGTVLYQWFLGSKESPFHAPNQYKVFMRIMTHEPPKLLELLPLDNKYRQVLQKLSSLIEMAMQKDPGKRIANAGILVRNLMNFHSILTGSSTHKWQQTNISLDFQRSLMNAAQVFGDKDVSLSGKKIVMDKINQIKEQKPRDAYVTAPIPQMSNSKEEPPKSKMYKSPRLARTTGALPRQHRRQSGSIPRDNRRQSGSLRRTNVEIHRDDIWGERQQGEELKIYVLIAGVIVLMLAIIVLIVYMFSQAMI